MSRFCWTSFSDWRTFLTNDCWEERLRCTRSDRPSRCLRCCASLERRVASLRTAVARPLRLPPATQAARRAAAVGFYVLAASMSSVE
jgi:hypothetical protein